MESLQPTQYVFCTIIIWAQLCLCYLYCIQRIEGLWSILRKTKSGWWITKFKVCAQCHIRALYEFCSCQSFYVILFSLASGVWRSVQSLFVRAQVWWPFLCLCNVLYMHLYLVIHWLWSPLLYRWCLAYVYRLFIKEDTIEFMEFWNLDHMKANKNASCPQGIPEDLYHLPQMWGKN